MAELQKRAKQAVTSSSAEQLAGTAQAFAPDADIYNNDDADNFNYVFVMDMPGVEKGQVHIEIDENNTLIVQGKTSFQEPPQALAREFRLGNYYRAFTLNNKVDKDHISARMENGVLEIRIPKREEIKPRKIKIST